VTALPKTPVLPAEYLAFDRSQEQRHELWDGEVFPMSAASMAHERVVRNLVRRLSEQLDGAPYEPFPSNLRVRIPGADRYVYPDALVACGPQIEDDHEDTLLNPRAIFEVLSPSTERFDRGEKFAGYRTIASLTDYVLLSTDRTLVEHYRRQEDDTWILRALEQGTLELSSVAVSIALDQLYRGVFD
jgi:Uma2 family endonuclease